MVSAALSRRDGRLLKRADSLSEERAGRRVRRNPPWPVERSPSLDRELRIDGLLVRFAPRPYADRVYRTVVERRQFPLQPFHCRSATVEITVRRLAGPPLRDAATGSPAEVEPEFDEAPAWNEYSQRHPDWRYAVAKRQLGKAELPLQGLRDRAPEDGLPGATEPPERRAFGGR